MSSVVASNMGKVSHALNHSATAAVNSAADRGHFWVVTPPHLRTTYNIFFLEDGCFGSWKMMVVSLSSL